jgi:hypothetical protein
VTTEQLNEELDAHCRIVGRRLREGKVVPFLGAGANLCGRPTDADWLKDKYLPSGAELAAYLAGLYAYPPKEAPELIRVSQYIQAVLGGNVLYDELRRLFTKSYEPTALHQLLAAIPAAVRKWQQEGEDSLFQLIITTNYDDALEVAFGRAKEEFDLVTYVVRGSDRGKFIHQRPDGSADVIEQPNIYRGLSLKKRTVILKIHGAVDRLNALRDSYVITEDNYIDYLAQTDISNLLPAALVGTMKESHFLFLGYSLADWNLRVILQRIWGEMPFEEQLTSWAIQRAPSHLEERLWRKRNVDILDVDLAEYVAAMRRGALPAADDEQP